MASHARKPARRETSAVFGRVPGSTAKHPGAGRRETTCVNEPYSRSVAEGERILRHFRIAAFLQIAIFLSAATPAPGQEMASAGDEPGAEHVRHLRSRRAAKPMLSTDEDKSEAGEASEAKSATPQAAKPVAADSARPTSPRQKKPPAKPVAAKQKPAPRKAISPSAPSAGTPAPASRGLLEDLFGDN